jgi:hypothetical protein
MVVFKQLGGDELPIDRLFLIVIPKIWHVPPPGGDRTIKLKGVVVTGQPQLGVPEEPPLYFMSFNITLNS